MFRIRDRPRAAHVRFD